MPENYDAVVVGSGPNGLAAAIEIARNGRSVLVLEADQQPGGGTRTQEVTLPGFKHDICSAIHPFGAASPFFKQLPLHEHGLEWIQPDVLFAHPMDDGSAVLVHRSVDDTADELGEDGDSYRKLMKPFVDRADDLASDFLGVLLKPKHPFLMARFGMLAIRSADKLLRSHFKTERARGMLAGNAAHAMLPLTGPLTGGFSLVYNVFGHKVGWPVARGGSQAIADALVSYLGSLGGVVECGRRVTSMADIPHSKVVLFDLAPKQILDIAGAELPDGYRKRLSKFRYGPGVFKIDWALDAPIPWKASGCDRTACLHLGGTMEEIEASEAASTSGRHPERPWVIVGQQSLFDDSRAPAGKHTGWAYMHVPNGSTLDMTSVIEDQMERFAPGFRDIVLARATKTAADFEAYNPNYVGGDIAAGAATLWQLLARPAPRWSPHSTPNDRFYICSSSTPPGPGVHGMCGYLAARAAMKKLR